MTIVVTGATGKLGRHVLNVLLERGVPAGEIIAAGRSIEKLQAFADKGVRVATMDYNDPASVTAALRGANKVLLIASSETDKDRPAQHRTVIEAAKKEDVELLAYTSAAKADTSPSFLAVDHKATEAILADAGVPYALLRNGYYFENWTDQLQDTLAQGVLLGAAGEGRISAATRRDLAEAAVAVLLGEDQAGKVYELGGDTAFTLTEFVAAITVATGTAVVYNNLSVPEYAATLASVGLPRPLAELLADLDMGLERGDMLVEGNALRTLIGRPTTTPVDAVREAVSAS